jgi:hypothetical protein
MQLDRDLEIVITTTAPNLCPTSPLSVPLLAQKHSDSPKLRSNPFEDGEGGSYELREVALKGSPKPVHNQTSNGYYLQAQDGNGDSNFDLHLDEDPLQLHYDGERDEEEDEKEEDGNDDFDVITIEEGTRARPAHSASSRVRVSVMSASCPLSVSLLLCPHLVLCVAVAIAGHRKHGAPMTPDEEAQYRSWVRWAIIVSWASVIIDLAFGFISLFIAIAGTHIHSLPAYEARNVSNDDGVCVCDQTRAWAYSGFRWRTSWTS